MNKEIIVNVGDRETRIAVLQDGRLVELQIERAERVVGSLYKCRVANVLPGMDAAFVDIGIERNAFLYVGDVLPPSGTAATDHDAKESDTQHFRRRGRSRKAAAAIVPAEPDMQTAAGHAELTDEADEFAAEEDEEDEEDELTEEVAAALADADESEEEGEPEQEESEQKPRAGVRRPGRNYRRSFLRGQNIKDVLHVGQELLVQVIKGPRSTKGARVSTRISLPGRYLVLMPEADNLGVSRKIEDAKERDRLKKIGDKIRVPGFGIIIRTEAEDKTEQELKADLDYLLQNWRQVQENSKKLKAPALVLQDLTLLYKTIRDVFGSDVNRLVIDDPAEYEKANELLERISPKLKGRIQLYDKEQPIFDHFGLESEIVRLMRRKVFLKSGGSLIIDETEALTVIDVNTSKNVGGASLADTILKTNVEAAAEIARQLRLRDIGGIIVIDFIDMGSQKDKQQVVKALETALKKDRSRTKISTISPLGLVEMTRKRTGETLAGFLTDECPYCRGRGSLPSPESVSLLAEREIRRRHAADAGKPHKEAVLVTCHPAVAELLIGPEGANVEELEREVQRAIYVRCDERLHLEAFTVDPLDMASAEKEHPVPKRAEVVDCRVSRSLLKEPNRCVGVVDDVLVDLNDGARLLGQMARVRVTSVRRSYVAGQVLGPGRD